MRAGMLAVFATTLAFFGTAAPMAIEPAPQGAWIAIPSMHAPARYGVSVAAGLDGRIYVVGGGTDCCSLGHAEAFDPATNTWTILPSMPTPRAAASAVMAGGRLYVIGGSSGAMLTTVEVYDPSTNSWGNNVAQLPVARSFAGAGVGADGRIYLVGGLDEASPAPGKFSNRLDTYDPGTDQWTSGPPSLHRREALGVTAGADGRIYALGGAPGFGLPAATAEVYDPATNAWSELPAMMNARRALGAATGADGRIYAIGGGNSEALRSVEVYDPLTDTWSPGPDLMRRRWSLGAARGGDGRIYIAGGFDALDDHFDKLTTTAEAFDPTVIPRPAPNGSWTRQPDLPIGFPMELIEAVAGRDGKIYANFGDRDFRSYDPLLGTWRTLPTMPTPRGDAALVAVPDGRIFAIGGYASGSGTSLVEAYDPATNSWSAALAQLPVFRFRSGAAIGSDGRVYVVGGLISGPDRARVDVYDIAADQWTQAPSLPTPRELLGVTAGPDGRIYAIGGNDAGIYSAGEVYDPETGVWSVIASMSVARHSLGVTTGLDGRIYAIGGHNRESSIMNVVEAYDPTTNTWTRAPEMLARRERLAAVTGIDGQIYAIGGYPNLSMEAFASTTAGLAISVDAPSTLSVEGGQYTPNPFNITATVVNGSDTTAENVQATLSLPPGLTLLSGAMTQTIGDLATSEQQEATWSVRAEGRFEPADLSYFVTAASASTTAAYKSGVLAVPGGVMTVNSIAPGVGGDTGFVTATVHGGGFQPGTTVRLTRSGEPDIVGANPTVSGGGTSVAATFDLTGAVYGAWSVVVASSAGTSASPTLPFAVVPGEKVALSAAVLGPTTFRSGRLATYYVAVTNTGLVDLWNVPIVFNLDTAPGSTGFFATALPVGAAAIAAPPAPFTTTLGHVPAAATVVVPGTITSSACPIAIAVAWGHWCFLELRNLHVQAQNFARRDLEAVLLYLEYDEIDCANQPQNDVDCRQLLSKINQNRQRVIDSIIGYIRALKALEDCLRRQPSVPLRMDLPPLPVREDPIIGPFLPTRLTLPSSGAPLLDELVRQPLSTSPSATDDIADFINSIIPPPGPILNQVLGCAVGSFDPNDKHGPNGSGLSRFIDSSPGSRTYQVAFENKPTATAAAQEVVITDQLDISRVDPATFTLGPIAFGDQLITPPPGLSQWSGDIDLRPAHNLILRINAGIDMATGLATWRFLSLDPATMLPTEDALAGFLPPNVTSPEGEGSVFFTISLWPDLPTGTEIRNMARIIFDTNDPIDTPEWLNTIDASKPASQVSSLVPQLTSPFAVSWNGTDEGAGVGDYTIYVSEDGGPYSIWLANTNETTVAFAGEAGKSYAFHSVARDLVGNSEEPPGSPDATTVVILQGDGLGNPIEMNTVQFSFDVDATGANTSGDEPVLIASSECGTSEALEHTVWMTFTAPAAGTMWVSTEGSGFDTVAAAFAGTPASGNQVGCNDDGPAGTSSFLAFPTLPGTTYWVEFGSWPSVEAGPLHVDADWFASTDVNCTHTTDGVDALSVLRHLAGLADPVANCFLDANRDASINLADVLYIRQSIAGLLPDGFEEALGRR